MAAELRCKVPIGMIEALREAGIPYRDVLAAARLPLDLLDQPGPRVSLPDYFALWQAIVTVSGNPTIGLVLPTLVRADITEPLFLAVLSAVDIAGAIEIVARYKRIFEPQDIVVRSNEAADQVELTLPDPESGLPQPPVLIDSQFAFIVEMCRRGTCRPDLNPRELRLRVTGTPTAPYAAFFRCPTCRSRRLSGTSAMCHYFDTKGSDVKGATRHSPLYHSSSSCAFGARRARSASSSVAASG